MTLPNAKLAASLEQLKVLQEQGLRAIRGTHLSRTHRERLLRTGYLEEVIKGWINYRDLDGARRYYQRYVKQGPYVEWAGNFGFDCQEPDFARARELAWEQREQAVRQALRPFKYALPLVLLALIASGIYWQRRRRTLAIVDKTAEETRHE